MNETKENAHLQSSNVVVFQNHQRTFIHSGVTFLHGGSRFRIISASCLVLAVSSSILVWRIFNISGLRRGLSSIRGNFVLYNIVASVAFFMFDLFLPEYKSEVAMVKHLQHQRLNQLLLRVKQKRTKSKAQSYQNKALMQTGKGEFSLQVLIQFF